MSGRAGWMASLALVASLACDRDNRSPFNFDDIVEPPRACVTVVHEALELGGPLAAFVSDSPGSPGGWGLVDLDGELAMVRVPATVDEPTTAPVHVGLPSDYADTVDLRAGALGGEAWVFTHAGAEVLIRLLPGHGEVGRNASLANFPAHDNSYCETQQTRVLVLIEGQPHILALPACSNDATLRLHLLSIERESLQFLTAWQLTFDPCAGVSDPTECALQAAYRISRIGPGQPSALPGLARVHVGFSQVRAYDDPAPGEPVARGTPFRTDVSMLDMRMQHDTPEVRLVTFPGVWTDSVPTLLSEVELSEDPFSTQMYVRNELVTNDAALLRFDTIADHYTQLRGGAELLPLDAGGHLIQLDNQGAILELDDGALLGVPLRDIDSWPTWTTETLLEHDELVEFELAGVGSLLLRFAEAPPQLIHVACAG